MKKLLLRLLTIITVFSMAFPMNAVHAQEVNEFDFESWHEEAMQAYDAYISLLESKVDDSTWKNVFDYAEITRARVKKIYLESVENATEEEQELVLNNIMDLMINPQYHNLINATVEIFYNNNEKEEEISNSNIKENS